jgi:uncharacterized protein YceK
MKPPGTTTRTAPTTNKTGKRARTGAKAIIRHMAVRRSWCGCASSLSEKRAARSCTTRAAVRVIVISDPRWRRSGDMPGTWVNDTSSRCSSLILADANANRARGSVVHEAKPIDRKRLPCRRRLRFADRRSCGWGTGLVDAAPDQSRSPTMAKSTNSPTEGVYRGTTTITLNGVLLHPGQRLPPP